MCTQAGGAVGGWVCLSPSRASGSALRPRSGSHVPKQAQGSKAGAASKLPPRAARTCSVSHITSALNVLGG